MIRTRANQMVRTGTSCTQVIPTPDRCSGADPKTFDVRVKPLPLPAAPPSAVRVSQVFSVLVV